MGETGRAVYSAMMPATAKPALELLRAWLPTVQAGQRIPADKALLIGPALREAQRLVMPASVEQIAIETKAMLDWAAGFGVPVKNPAAVTRAYLEALRTVPTDLLPLAMERARSTHVYGQRLPLPKEILDRVKPEMDERWQQNAKLRLAASLEREPPGGKGQRWDELTPEQQAEHETMMAGVRARFASQRQPEPEKPRPPARRYTLPTPDLNPMHMWNWVDGFRDRRAGVAIFPSEEWRLEGYLCAAGFAAGEVELPAWLLAKVDGDRIHGPADDGYAPVDEGATAP